MSDSRKCPKCGTWMKRHNTVELRGKTKIETVGYHYFCPNRNCSYEEDE